MKAIKLFFILFFAMLLACDDENGEMEIIPENEVTCEEDGVTFSATGQHGENLLRDANSDIDTLQTSGFADLSLSATTTANCTVVKIVLTNIEGDCEGCWFYIPAENNNWDVSEYNFSDNSQTFTSTGMEMDLQIYGFSGGIYQIDYFVNDSLTHTNFLQSIQDYPEVFLQNEPVSSFTEGNNGLYIASIGSSENYYGIMDVANPDAGVSKKFTGGIEITEVIASKDDELYYYDYTANAIRKLNMASADPEPVDVINSVGSIWDMVIDGDMLYMTFQTSQNSAVGQVDLSVENPMIDTISIRDDNDDPFGDVDVKNNTLYISTVQGLATMDLADETFAITLEDNYFSDEDDRISNLLLLSIKVSDTHVYYTGNGIVARIDLITGEKEFLVQTNLNDFFLDIHVEEDFIIFTDPFKETIYKYDL